jgi:hypothetical protein
MRIIHFFHLAKILFEPRHTLITSFYFLHNSRISLNNRVTFKMPWVEILATSSVLIPAYKMHNLRVAVTLIKRAPKPAFIEKTVYGSHAYAKASDALSFSWAAHTISSCAVCNLWTRHAKGRPGPGDRWMDEATNARTARRISAGGIWLF